MCGGAPKPPPPPPPPPPPTRLSELKRGQTAPRKATKGKKRSLRVVKRSKGSGVTVAAKKTENSPTLGA
jgi:hypothetical protein